MMSTTLEVQNAFDIMLENSIKHKCYEIHERGVLGPVLHTYINFAQKMDT